MIAPPSLPLARRSAGSQLVAGGPGRNHPGGATRNMSRAVSAGTRVEGGIGVELIYGRSGDDWPRNLVGVRAFERRGDKDERSAESGSGELQELSPWSTLSQASGAAVPGRRRELGGQRAG